MTAPLTAAQLQLNARTEEETTLIAFNGEFDEGWHKNQEIDLRPPIVMTVVCGLFFAYLRTPLPLALFVGAACYLAGRVVKKLTDSYDFMRDIEEWSLKLVRNIPYLHIITSILVVIFSFILIQLAIAFASSMGLLNAFTIDTENYGVASSQNVNGPFASHPVEDL